MPVLQYAETPLEELRHPVMDNAGVRLLVKREDLNHHLISGNKWWKLKYNLQAAKENGFATLLTFGGAYSNHIYATAAACSEVGIKSIGIVRGEQPVPLNNTLHFAEKQGMLLHFVPRSVYRLKTEAEYLQRLKEEFGSFYLVPEGGTNLLGIKGAEEFVHKISAIEFDYVFVPVGTGGTISGLIAGLKGNKKIVGIPVLKTGEFLRAEVEDWLIQYSGRSFDNWNLLTHHHHGGYAKTTAELIQFMLEMKNQYNLPLDQVYTAKLLYAIFEEVKSERFERGTTILAIHTGGLQGSMLH